MRGEHVLDRRSPSHADRSRRENPESEPRRRERFEVVGVGEECERVLERQRDELRRSMRRGGSDMVETGRNARKRSTASFRRLRSVRDLGPHAFENRRVDGDAGTRAPRTSPATHRRRVAVRGDGFGRRATAKALPTLRQHSEEAAADVAGGARDEDRRGGHARALRRLPLRDPVEAAGAETDGKLVRCAGPASASGTAGPAGGVRWPAPRAGRGRSSGRRRGPAWSSRPRGRALRSACPRREEDPPRVRAQDKREGEQGDVVQLAGRTR